MHVARQVLHGHEAAARVLLLVQRAPREAVRLGGHLGAHFGQRLRPWGVVEVAREVVEGVVVRVGKVGVRAGRARQVLVPARHLNRHAAANVRGVRACRLSRPHSRRHRRVRRDDGGRATPRATAHGGGDGDTARMDGSLACHRLVDPCLILRKVASRHGIRTVDHRDLGAVSHEKRCQHANDGIVEQQDGRGEKPRARIEDQPRIDVVDELTPEALRGRGPGGRVLERHPARSAKTEKPPPTTSSG